MAPGTDSADALAARLALAAGLEGVPSAMTAARDGIDALLRDRGLRRTGPDVTSESVLRGAVASATLAGSTSSAEEIRRGDGDPTAQAALRVGTELLGLVPVLARAPAQALARLHVLAVGPGEPTAGRPVDDDGARRLLALGRWLVRPTEAPALVVAALAHAEVAAAAPFGPGSDLVARGLERLLLVSRGVDPASVTVPEAGHLHSRAAYDATLAAYRARGETGLQAWLLHCAGAYAAGAEASPLADGPGGG